MNYAPHESIPKSILPLQDVEEGLIATATTEVRSLPNRVAVVGDHTGSIAPHLIWEFSHAKTFNTRLRDELHDGEIFPNTDIGQALIEPWRRHGNTFRPRDP